MPLPMVHLLLARVLEEKLSIKDNDYFILGSIAPDAIHARAGSKRLDKYETHMFVNGFHDEISKKVSRASVLEVMKYSMNLEREERQFVLGYCIHILLDMEWIDKVFNVFARTLQSGGICLDGIKSKYYEETNECDALIYIKGHLWTEKYRRILQKIEPIGFYDYRTTDNKLLLTKEEIGKWREEVLGKMERYADFAVGKVTGAHYITYESILSFINKFADSVIISLIDRL